MKIAALQMDIAWEDRKANFEKVARFAKEAAGNGADFLVLPEMFATGFSMNTAVTAESIDGPTPTFIRELSSRFQMGILGGFVLKQADEKARNCALAVNRKGEDLALYTKTYLFSYMKEDKHHQAGRGPIPFYFEGTRCACFICYDLRFPELFREICHTTDVVFVIASWPSARAYHWETLLAARAVENQFYIAGVNRIGLGDGLAFAGSSCIIDPSGIIESKIVEAEGFIYGDILPERVKAIRDAMPFLRDCRLFTP